MQRNPELLWMVLVRVFIMPGLDKAQANNNALRPYPDRNFSPSHFSHRHNEKYRIHILRIRSYGTIHHINRHTT